MSQITMAEALAVRAAMNRLINQLMQERLNNSSTIIEKGETAEVPARSVDVITEEIDAVSADFRKLDLLMAISNTTETIPWNGTNITVMEAIELAKQMRNEIGQLAHLGSRKKLERQTSRGLEGGAVTLFNVALYDPEAYHAAARKKEREVTKLSSLIEHANHHSKIPFDAAKYME
ncbi:hypothetical protein [Paenibacillus ihbetae]|uniref:Uncharacterized protein n=1 Tax=Paenibacillus ihbetae TaxID=1870820 RepID=A0A1B2E710_9BACL|nr:hypothetical protein [Paenibacillus ihbetae]ANY75739.1 hypothetical protein BBD41_25920 [Paenibacillus ihbetae]OOC62090.1 hypothetical protein BBD40_09640 [Paenibacillus ihbetae]